MTSAPKSASIAAAEGTSTIEAASTTRMPSSSPRVMGAMVTELAAAHELDPADPAARAVDGRAQRLADDRRTARRLAHRAEPELPEQQLEPRRLELGVRGLELHDTARERQVTLEQGELAERQRPEAAHERLGVVGLVARGDARGERREPGVEAGEARLRDERLEVVERLSHLGDEAPASLGVGVHVGAPPLTGGGRRPRRRRAAREGPQEQHQHDLCRAHHRRMLAEKPRARWYTRPVSLEYPWAEPPAPGEVIAVAPGIAWLRMPLPFRLNHINLWLLD